jgi:hypothetical protein
MQALHQLCCDIPDNDGKHGRMSGIRQATTPEEAQRELSLHKSRQTR